MVKKRENSNKDVTTEELAAPVLRSPNTFRVIVKNSCPYPARILTFMDEETAHSSYVVFKTFEKKELEINLLTFRHLQLDPKVRMTRIGTND